MYHKSTKLRVSKSPEYTKQIVMSALKSISANSDELLDNALVNFELTEIFRVTEVLMFITALQIIELTPQCVFQPTTDHLREEVKMKKRRDLS